MVLSNYAIDRQIIDLLVRKPSQEIRPYRGERERCAGGTQPLGDLGAHAGWMQGPTGYQMIAFNCSDRHVDFEVVAMIFGEDMGEGIPAG